MENKIGWIAHEYMGVKVYDLEFRQLKNKNDVIAGMEILIPSPFGKDTYFKAKVNKNCTFAETEDCFYALDFDKNERHCWVNSCSAHKGALRTMLKDNNGQEKS